MLIHFSLTKRMLYAVKEIILRFFFFFFLFTDAPAAYGSSWARGLVQLQTYATATATLD